MHGENSRQVLLFLNKSPNAVDIRFKIRFLFCMLGVLSRRCHLPWSTMWTDAALRWTAWKILLDGPPEAGKMLYSIPAAAVLGVLL